MTNLQKTVLFFMMLTFCVFAQQVGTQAPPFTLNTLDNGQISLSDYYGEVVYLFFFGWG